MTTTARERIKALLDTGTELSDESVAITVMADLGVPTKASQALVDIVASDVANQRRARVRSIEAAAFDEPRVQSPRRTLGSTPVDRIDARKRLLDERFHLPNGRSVRWGDATVADHRERIDMQERLRGGIAVEIGRHTAAIAEIEAAGVTCLREIAVAA